MVVAALPCHTPYHSTSKIRLKVVSVLQLEFRTRSPRHVRPDVQNPCPMLTNPVCCDTDMTVHSPCGSQGPPQLSTTPPVQRLGDSRSVFCGHAC